jgi:hypothetical protein
MNPQSLKQIKNRRFFRIAKDRLAPHGNALAAIGTACASAYFFSTGNPRMATDLADISVLTLKTWIMPYVGQGKGINYLSIAFNGLDSILMEGATQVWGIPTYRGTHIITIVQSVANLTELYLKRNTEINSTKETPIVPRTDYINSPAKTDGVGPNFFISRLYSIRV